MIIAELLGAGGAVKAVSSRGQCGGCRALSGLLCHPEGSIHPAKEHNFTSATGQTNAHSCSAPGKGREVWAGEGS